MVSSADDAPALQFETALPPGVNLDAATRQTGLTCIGCQQVVTDEYFDVNGQPACAACRSAIIQQAEPSKGTTPFVRSALFGIGAAVAGAVVYYAVIAITNFEIGLVAIAIGYMVGYAIRKGADGHGGRKLQVMALVLTYWAVGLAYVPLAFTAAAQSQQEAQAQAGTPAARAEADRVSQEFNLPLAVVLLVGFSFALPVLIVFGTLPGGLITAAIVAFGMHQAWRMTGVPEVTVTGPFRVGHSDASDVI
jgi:hypothetical protein